MTCYMIPLANIPSRLGIHVDFLSVRYYWSNFGSGQQSTSRFHSLRAGLTDAERWMTMAFTYLLAYLLLTEPVSSLLAKNYRIVSVS